MLFLIYSIRYLLRVPEASAGFRQDYFRAKLEEQPLEDHHHAGSVEK